MSRILAYAAPRPLSAEAALGRETLASFLALASLHRDGWGHACAEASADPPAVTTGLSPAREALPPVAATPTRVSLMYLRFASSGSAVSPENLQPFARSGAAFAHNGALVPKTRAEERLSVEERQALRGTTDSEVYFALLLRELRETGHPIERALARAASRMRGLYPEACLNALLVTEGSLYAIHSAGTVAPPLAAFAARGVEGAQLPPGHDAGYNVLHTAVLESGARAVATTGIDTTGWQPLDPDTVFAFTPEGRVRTAAIS
ncbi:class II glutamine amidotransferase [Salinibacterium sp. SYSU T00001]|uniref:class II glutamine amidotransferase n=1 Tax=Homoserinimonas sedimenticola TaxID=2986805 RepID=UPI00223644AA|nr:class II glutamine amidotransferase [Salinibacterium sedimenticola]MCW4385376.1 class II glutamine amidotransferase [Salinibacterium sedimenticola]